MAKRYCIQCFTKDGELVQQFFETPLEVQTFVKTCDSFSIFRDNIESMYFLKLNREKSYEVKERIRWFENDFGYCSHPIYCDVDNDEILTTVDLEYLYNTSDQKQYYDNLQQYINACRTYNNGTLEEI